MRLIDIKALGLPPLEHSLVLTPNNRIARTFRETYFAEQLEAAGGRPLAIADIPVFPIGAWLRESAIACQDAACSAIEGRQILTDDQELVLWEQVIVAHYELHGSFVTKPQAVAKAARQAWALLLQWQAELDDPEFNVAADGEVFRQWAAAFRKLCDEQGLLSQAEVPQVVIDAIGTGSLTLPEHVVFLAFDDLPPIYERLRTAIAEAGAQLHDVAPEVANRKAVRTMAANADEEIRSAALWAKSVLEREPGARVGIVLPELARMRDQVLRTFSSVFEPQHILPDVPRYTPPFNISAGVPFPSVPVIRAAFRCLSLDARRLPLDEFSGLIRTPFIGGSVTEASARAQLDVALRDLRLPKLSIKEVTDNALTHDCPDLAARLKRFVDLRHGMEQALPSQWAYVFNDRLVALGWPGERALDSEEYQAVDRWSALLDKMAHMDTVEGQVSLPRALQLLQQLAGNTIFAPETSDSPIQILGALEAAGLQFSHLWVANMTDEVWPAPAKPNPYIPVPLQRRLDMPHSSAQRELAFARTLTRRYLRSAFEVIMSYPRSDADRPLRPSPLITRLPLEDIATIRGGTFEPMTAYLRGALPTEEFADGSAPALPEGARVHGGVGVLARMAACPFKSFVEDRLRARPFESPSYGLSGNDRGILVHRALQTFWDEVKTHAALVALDDLSAAVERHVDDALTSHRANMPALRSKTLFQIERRRLIQLLTRFLTLETERAPFEVTATELPLEASLGGLRFRFTIDRIDRVGDEDGQDVLVDYKSVGTAVSSWEGARPDDPQLPVYASLHKRPVAGVAFAELRAKSTRFQGVTADEGLLPGVNTLERSRTRLPPNWSALLKMWGATTTALAEGYRTGIATIDPKKGAETCKHCSGKAFCRT